MNHVEWLREMGSTAITYEINPAMIVMARDLPTYRGTTDRMYMSADSDGAMKWVTENKVPCTRCTACDDEILPDDLPARLGHLFSNHGWRMNGKQYDGKNNVIGEVNL